MLEGNLHASSVFVTLTYSDSNLPLNSSPTHGDLPTLNPIDYRNFLKRLRKATAPSKIRFYLCGEYGNKTWRPHYHAVIFNYPHCSRGQTKQTITGQPDPENCCPACRLMFQTWGMGLIYMGALETSSAQYCSGYVTKKMTKRQDPRLLGREPEFARMSLKPGIGADFMHEVASTMLTHDLDQTEGDVPVSLRHGSRQLPLGRYLRKKLRVAIGRDEKTPQHIIDEQNALMQDVYLRHKSDPDFISIKRSYIEENQGKNDSQASLDKIHTRKKSL